MPDFDAVYQALADRLAAELGDVVRAVFRDNRDFTRCPSQPALLVLEASVGPSWDTPGLPPVWQPTAILTLYTQASAGDEKPGAQVVDLVARVHEALAWKRTSEPRGDGYSTTLGGLVRYARISGDVVIGNHPAALSQMITEIPVEMELEPEA